MALCHSFLYSIYFSFYDTVHTFIHSFITFAEAHLQIFTAAGSVGWPSMSRDSNSGFPHIKLAHYHLSYASLKLSYAKSVELFFYQLFYAVRELNAPVLTDCSSCSGIDFSVCLWDIYTGSLVHRFSSHGGEVSFKQRDRNTERQNWVTSMFCS